MATLRETVSALTFVGVIFHEFGHQVFCNLTGVRVQKVCYFRFGNPSGYVIHERPKKFYQSFLIAVGPFISGAFFSMLFYYLSKTFTWQEWQKYLLIWLGASVAISSFPSDTDALNLWKDTNRHIFKNLLALIGYPVTIVLWIANSLTVVWFDLFYAGFLYYLVEIYIQF